jgi:hypothetical protein
VLLTTNGHNYEKIIRNDDGVLQLEQIVAEASL